MKNSKLMARVFASYLAMFKARIKQNRKNGRSEYLKSVEQTAALLRQVSRNSSFEEQLTIVKATQEFDLMYLARTSRHRASINVSRENIRRGENHYRMLRDKPECYRDDFAAGFVRQDCLPGGALPRDGMQKALTSHLKHLTARTSMMLQDEEEAFVDAQIVLLNSMLDGYTALQRELLPEDAALVED